MIAGKKAPKFSEMPADYAGLLGMHAPRVLHNKSEAETVRNMLTAMSGFNLSADQAAYAELLGRLYADWAARAKSRKRAKPADLVRHAVEQHAMTQADMATVFGVTQGHVSQILAGKRALSRACAERFAAKFKVSLESLL